MQNQVLLSLSWLQQVVPKIAQEPSKVKTLLLILWFLCSLPNRSKTLTLKKINGVHLGVRTMGFFFSFHSLDSFVFFVLNHQRV